MKIKLIAVGKTDDAYILEGINAYLKRLPHYTTIELVIIPSLKTAKNLSPEELKQKEGALILQQINSSDTMVLLDEKGKEFTSREFAGYMEKKQNQSIKNLVFIIGGAYGFSEQVYKRANEKIALSKMTFSHQMIRLFFVEQLYRAMTIIRNESYHHD